MWTVASMASKAMISALTATFPLRAVGPFEAYSGTGAGIGNKRSDLEIIFCVAPLPLGTCVGAVSGLSTKPGDAVAAP